MSLKPSQQLLAMSLVGLLLAAPAVSGEGVARNEWTFNITPYLWLPNINGTLKYQLPEEDEGADVGVGPADYLSHLDTLLMLGGEARKGRWMVTADLIFLDFNKSGSYLKTFGGAAVPSSVNLDTQSSLTGEQWLLAAGYAVTEHPTSQLDAIAGIRYMNITASTQWDLTGPIGAVPATGSLETKSD